MLSVIILSIIVIVLSLFVRHEHYSNKPVALLSPSIKQAIEKESDQVFGTTCKVKTASGSFVEMTSKQRPIDWYQNPDRQQSCSIDIANDDFNNDISVCSKANRAIYNPNIVENIYIDDAFDGAKRCVVDFRQPQFVTPTEMTNYLRNLTSYKAVDTEIFNKDELKKQLHLTKEQEQALDYATKQYIEEGKKKETAIKNLYKAQIDAQNSLTRAAEAKSAGEIAAMNYRTAQSKAEKDRWLNEIAANKQKQEYLLKEAKEKENAYLMKISTTKGQIETHKATRRELQNMINALKKPVDCVVGEWGAWSQCSKPCGEGRRYRQRQIITAPRNGPVCPALHEEQSCNTQVCPPPTLGLSK